jgi:uncharacterized protein YecE (DUF72 family)
MSGRLFVGTSGFAFPQWRGHLYPEGLSPKKYLSVYATHFSSVEINYTFHRRVEESTLAGWRDSTPEGFEFSLKAHQLITHRFRLGSAAPQVASEFVQRASTLGSRLGPVLFQCPPQLAYDPPVLERFLDGLPGGHRYAFEFRHPSWADARSTLLAHGVTWCIAETDEQPVRGELGDVGPFAYLRLRREQYSPAALGKWAKRFGDKLEAGSNVYCYVKHEEGTAGPEIARRIVALTERSAPRSANAR